MEQQEPNGTIRIHQHPNILCWSSKTKFHLKNGPKSKPNQPEFPLHPSIPNQPTSSKHYLLLQTVEIFSKFQKLSWNS
jgi:hypothetical protein